MTNNRELLNLLMNMVKATRCCQQDSAFCGGVTFTQFYIIDLLKTSGTLRLSDLHEQLAVEKSTSTRLLEPLVQRGIVLKNRSENDSRAIDLKLTNEGKLLYSELWQCMNDFFNRLSAEIPEDKRTEVHDNVIVFVRAVMAVFTRSGGC